MAFRDTRRFKTRSNFVLSFGDLMLPVVGIVAVGLLFVAGKFFFSSGFQTDRPHLPLNLTEFPRTSIIEEKPTPASAEENDAVRQDSASAQSDFDPGASFNPENSPGPSPVVVTPAGGSAPASQNSQGAGPLAFPGNKETTTEKQENEKPASVANGTPEKEKLDNERLAAPVTQEKVVVIPVSRPQASSSPSQTPAARREPVKPQQTRSTPPNSPKPAPQPAAQQPAMAQNPSWMVQLGAFSTQGAAETFSKSVTKTGHKPVIISNRTLHRVLIPSGATKAEATSLATRMIQAGFQGAFIVPPRS